ncbi:sigma-70 family RNA polymerase sigma factor [Rhizobium leguminosarum]|uniref:sigma-70 family RNA polymerase sigma factor n=1 Tax=Rhizobium leguminosarum TaxID=384 RepID=UPI00098E92BB|nr:sigma-70 family RNA polymerase sigma factor [Rhizobium leguminosarum]ASS58054.1 RNA polymerase subunit sigma [Rhizobium leguminosarum bv. viciae]MBY5488435.1 sigma-70 family RNA polymerase sigma factor [Rhizobium leguminosarum]MDX6006468.1 sigma-70 family RNA polymerase sigma factor [Rhizobium leguminosarum]NKK15583.1 sigma-70 family RNA polymerase sigma factor [Rhizobium leguminosarum bv. viciae]NKK31046.1 sigma-70 family RNA polymerase sigma factor [Rhizobium leguminosarum bv. viciae]
MQDDGRRRLTLVASDGEATSGKARGILDSKAGASRDLDWTILMARAQDGDNFAYLRLLQEITPYLRSLVRRWHKDHWDIEDTVQDILLTLHSIRHTYDPSRPFGPWLVGIANRRAIDRLRRRGRQELREAPLTAEHEATAAASEHNDDVLDKHRLNEALGGLPPIQRTAVDLLKLKEMSLKEASDATGLSIASLKMATHRALRNLRTLLSDRRDS